MKQVNPRVLVLTSILNRLGSYNIKTFESRLVLQKTVYFLQKFGLDFGYKFTWYVYGPYSTDLTKESYEIEELDKVPSINFIDPKFEAALNKMKEFVGDKKTNANWLELLASISFLKSLGKTEKEIREVIHHKRTHFTDQQYESACQYLNRWKI